MQLSAAGLELIKQSEGFRGRVYRDVAGIWTIGYGHRVLPGEDFSEEISQEQAARILRNDIAETERALARLVSVTLTQGQFDALADFCFNLGAGRLANSTLLRALNAGLYDAAANQLLLWDHAAGKVNVGLKARREAEYRLWRGREVAASEPPSGSQPALAAAHPLPPSAVCETAKQ